MPDKDGVLEEGEPDFAAPAYDPADQWDPDAAILDPLPPASAETQELIVKVAKS